MQILDHERSGYSREDAANGDFIGDDEVLKIDESGAQKARDKETKNEGETGGVGPVDEPTGQEEGSGHKLDDEIAYGDAGSAIGATTAKDQPGENRNI